MRNVSITVFLAVVEAASLTAAIRQPVKVDGGLVSGTPAKDAKVFAFKGIPFAAPPVGSRRWAAPASVKPWNGVRAGDQFGASCIQNIVTERKPWTYEFMAHNEVSEDCLYLNVWTAAQAASEKSPVYVFIYGGGFQEGSTAVPVYDGEGLARKGLVVVTMNYRVGLLGFLALPELSKESGHNASGNYGLLDQIAALRWVRKNIAAFGGDPDRVTIAGQSAGGTSVHILTASPLAKGLFERAVVESGGSSIGGGGSSTLAQAEAEGQKFAEAKGAKSLAELRAMSWQKLAEPLPAGSGSLRFRPILDGYVQPMTVRETIQKGMQNDVATLTGVNLGELGGIGGAAAAVTAEGFRAQAQKRYGDLADEFLRLYPAADDEQARASQAASARDQALVSLYLWSRERAKTAKTPAYLYLWDHALPGPDAARFGAFHTSEVPYALNTLSMSSRPFVDADWKMADMLSSYWANFAKTGNPNGGGLPDWEPAGEAHEIMELGDKTGPIAPADKARFAFFEKVLSR